MKRFLSNTPLVIAVRVVLGLIFVFASVDKIADPAAFSRSIMNYHILPYGVAMVIATILPWMELLCGLTLLSGVLVQGSALLVLAMLIVFTGAVFSALIRGLDISCGCFTQDPTAGRIGWWKIAENIGMILLSAFLYFSRSMRFSLEELVRSKPSRLPG
jgi:uncharacterized membrane protein YphA (DoxX/SURF4 family)